MMPVYPFMESYPQQKNQIPFAHYRHPGFEASPPFMMVNPYANEQTRPFSGNYCYQMPCHSCCSHSGFHGCYNYRPPCPQIPPPLPMHCWGSYPTYPEVYPVHYGPPPHYSMDLPRYEYGKDGNDHFHCCGCPNHPSYHKEDKAVKIEEQDPGDEKRASNSMVPMQARYYPYPILWVPPEYKNKREPTKLIEPEVAEKDKVSWGTKSKGHNEVNEKQPVVWNGWNPFDMSGFPSFMHGGNGKSPHNQQDDTKGRQFPFPVIWISNPDKQEHAEKTNGSDENTSPKSTQEASHAFQAVPFNISEADDDPNKATQNFNDDKEAGASDEKRKETNEKSIPVMQIEMPKEKSKLEGSDKKLKDIPVEHVKENVKEEDARVEAKKQPSSPPRTSKLPPVCLRVDPLPKKKNGKGSSRSPSPPASKEHLQEMPKERVKTSASSGIKEQSHQEQKLQCNSEAHNRVQLGQHEIVTEEKRSKDADPSAVSQSEISTSPHVKSSENVTEVTGSEESRKLDDERRVEGDISQRNVKNITTENGVQAKDKICSTEQTNNEGEQKERVLSDEKAATLIQSVFRGYEVRKWEPLKKIKQMAEVCKQVADVQDRIQVIENSADLQRDEKYRIMIGETIMRLLLNLDAIQGLHPSLREIRKSLARELSFLQEKLDSIAVKISEEPEEKLAAINPLEDAPVDAQRQRCTKERQEKQVALPKTDILGGNHETRESCFDGEKLDSTGKIAGDENRELPVDICIEPNSERESFRLEKVKELEAMDECKSNINSFETKQTSMEKKCKPEMECESPEIEVMLQGVVNDKSEQKGAKSEMDGISVVNNEMDRRTSEELPCILLDSESERHIKGEHESVQEGFSSDVDNLEMAHREILEELPCGVIDEELHVSEESNVSSMSLGVNLPKETVNLEVVDSNSTLRDGGHDLNSSYEKHEEVEDVEPVPQPEGGDCNKTSSAVGECSDKPHLELQSIGIEHQGMHSDEDLNDWAKVHCVENIEVPEESSIDEEMNNQPEKQDISAAFELVETQTSSEVDCDDDDDDVVPEEDVDKQFQNQNIVVVAKKTGEDEEKSLTEVDEKAKHEGDLENQLQVYETVDELGDQENNSGPLGEKTYGERQSPPSPEGQPVEEEQDSSMASIVECDVSSGQQAERQLIEENEKLREMMEKLIEAGKVQLDNISSLSGRVKDLEKKLARKKKARTRRYRPAASKSSCVKQSSNNLLREKPLGVAI